MCACMLIVSKCLEPQVIANSIYLFMAKVKFKIVVVVDVVVC